MKRIYMDNAATTQMDARVLRAMLPYFSEKFGNASSLHSFGREAREAVEKAREIVAKTIGAKGGEVYFTSGGTEADNLAVKGAALAGGRGNGHIITSAIEHPAVLEPCRALQAEGFGITYARVDGEGFVKPDELEKAIGKKTILVSVMHANNEIGTIQPISEIGKMCGEGGITFHTDAVQTLGKIPVDVDKLKVDLLSMSSHKVYGPKGVGALFVREGTEIKPLLHGGGHEHGMRSGTENVAGIAGFGEACRIAGRGMWAEGKKLSGLRDYLISGTLAEIPRTRLNGSAKKRLPGNANFSFDFIEGESLIMLLDAKGIAASTGSACSTKSLKPSHVLLAIGLSPVQAHGSLRLSLGRENTRQEADYLLGVLPGIVERLRRISPLKEG